MAENETTASRNRFEHAGYQGLLSRVLGHLPHGGTLPDEFWQSRHRFLLGLTWLHATLIALVGPVLGYRWDISFAAIFENGMVLHTIAEGLAVALFAAVAAWGTRRRDIQATAVALGLMTSSAFLAHLSGGYIELHFHFFVMVAFLALYQDWAPYLLAIIFVIVHHGIFGVLWPAAVFNDAAALNAPWTWAGIHAFFILWTAAASVVAWRFNEKATAQVKLILNSVGEGIFGLDQEGKVTFVNPTAARLLGWNPVETVGRPVTEILRHPRTDGSAFTEEDCPMFTSLREGTRQSGSDRFFARRDGTSLPVDFVSTPIIEAGQVKGAVISFRDVTTRRNAQERLRRIGELQTLHEINRVILESLDVNLMMERILDKVFAIGGFDVGMICFVTVDRTTLEPVAHRGFRSIETPNRYRDRIRERATAGIVDQVITTRKTHSVNLRQRGGVRTFREEGVQSLVVVPLRTERDALGIIYLGSRVDREFQENEIGLFDAIGLQVGIAIQKARLFERAQLAKKEVESTNLQLERLLEDQAKLYADLTPLARAESIPQLLEKVIDRLIEATGADAASIRFLDPQTQTFYVPAQRGFPTNYLEAPGGKIAGRATAVVFDTGEPIIAPDIETDPRIIRKFQKDAGFRSCAFLPLKVRNEVRGLVQLASREQGYFHAGREGYLMAIVRQIGIALENRELFEEVNAAKIELERSNAELQQFAYVASHDLQEPLRMISGYTQLLAKRYQGRLDSDADEFIGFAVSGANRMHALIQALLEFSRAGLNKRALAPVDLEAAFQVALAALRAAIQESGATVSHDPLPNVMGDEMLLVQLFQNLVGNGIKFRDGKRPEIHVSCKLDNQRWVFSVKDNGIGIDPQYAERIFLLFQRLHTQQEYSGTGIGLALCKKIVERHGGRIWVESAPGKGCEFCFTLPA